MATVDALGAHCRVVHKLMEQGAVVPFLGAGANMCDRPTDINWLEDHYLPRGSELAEHLAEQWSYPFTGSNDLVRVAQYIDLMTGGEQALFEALHELFTRDYQPNRLHDLLARIPAALRANGRQCPLIVTTNYDDCLEQAFRRSGERFDLLYYTAEPDQPGRLVHVTPDGDIVTNPRHATYRGFALDQRAVILKIHGAVNRDDGTHDSYVITEDHYIDYLSRTNMPKLIPAQLMSKMVGSHFLFLGYSMRDWNLRVLLKRVWTQQTRKAGSWAIDVAPDPIDERLWARHNVEVVRTPLEAWVETMTELMG